MASGFANLLRAAGEARFAKATVRVRLTRLPPPLKFVKLKNTSIMYNILVLKYINKFTYNMLKIITNLGNSVPILRYSVIIKI